MSVARDLKSLVSGSVFSFPPGGRAAFSFVLRARIEKRALSGDFSPRQPPFALRAR